jgi:ABC-type polysaccharide/polyol phosphate export permease
MIARMDASATRAAAGRFSTRDADTLFGAIREVLASRDLLYMITWREVKVKYKQSIMGMLWAVLMPLVIVGAGLIVRLAFTEASGTSLSMLDLASVVVKASPWAFFVSVLRFGTNSLVTNTNLVTKIYLPRLIFPLAAMLAQLVDFGVAVAVVGVFLVVVRVGVSAQLLWLPLLVAVLVVMATSLAVILSAASLFFRDVKYIVEVLLTFAIFFTPVFYDSSLFGRWAPVLLLNPVSPVLEGMASVVVAHREPSLLWLSYSVAITALLFVASLMLFKKLEPYFAESV